LVSCYPSRWHAWKGPPVLLVPICGLHLDGNRLICNTRKCNQFASKPLIFQLSKLTLNQRVQGSSPCAPTKYASNFIKLCQERLDRTTFAVNSGPDADPAGRQVVTSNPRVVAPAETRHPTRRGLAACARSASRRRCWFWTGARAGRTAHEAGTSGRTVPSIRLVIAASRWRLNVRRSTSRAGVAAGQ
jgi:hypothetical protein